MLDALTIGSVTVAKKKQAKSTLYAEIPATLKLRFEAIAKRSGRKLNAELIYALEAYCSGKERTDGVDVEGDEDEDE